MRNTEEDYLRCLLTIFARSNMEIWDFPSNRTLSLASALIIRLFVLSCNLFFLIYSQIFLMTSVLGNGLEPTTSANAGLAVNGAMKAAFGVRLAFLGAAFFTAFLAAFAGDFLAAFLAALGAAFFAAFFGLAGMCFDLIV